MNSDRDATTQPAGGGPLPSDGKPPKEQPVSPGAYTGQIFGGRYDVGDRLAVGGVGEVYRAVDKRTGAAVVIKVLSEKSHNNPWLRTKFQQEATVLKRIQHPGVISMLDTGSSPDGRLFLVLPFCQGETLAAVLKRGKLPLDRAADIFRQLGEAVGAIHDAGIWHRDLKPANIMIETDANGSDHVLVIDLGIATLLDQLSTVGGTQVTASAGTPSYMAPEQLRGRVKKESDLWALGVIAYKMLTGNLPFNGQTPTEIAELQSTAPPPPSAHRPDLGANVDRLIARALTVEARLRLSLAADFGHNLALALTSKQAPAEAAATDVAAGVQRVAEIVVCGLPVWAIADKSGQECLVYSPNPVGMEVPERQMQPIDSDQVRAVITEIRDEIAYLNQLAMRRARWEEDKLTNLGAKLAGLVLPPGGFVGLFSRRINPMLDLDPVNLAAEIPWEILVERGTYCLDCNLRDLTGAKFCGRCGKPLEARSERFALTWHLCHLVRGGGARGDGRKFLFIEDPTRDPQGDLCKEEHDPDGFCRGHLEDLHTRIERLGFTLDVLVGPNATVSRVESAIADPEVAGIYYFGHGYFPRNREEGCLLLADGELTAGRIRNAGSRARLVFLNACEGADSGREWKLENRPRSVAAAFAQGRADKTVIAPLWPVVNVQAAGVAIDFFRAAAEGRSFGEALRIARTTSFRQFEASEPHVAFVAYRYFGDPNQTFAAPQETPAVSPQSPAPVDAKATTTAPPESTAMPPRLFAEDGRLQRSLFAFDIDPPLLRAAKRRNFQARRLLSATDFFAGLLRLGNLTRILLSRAKVNADELYERLRDRAEPGERIVGDRARELLEAGVENLNDETMPIFAARWLIRNESDFTPELLEIFAAADRRAQTRGQLPVTEKDLILASVESPAWAAMDPHIPSATEIRALCEDPSIVEAFDENGAVSLGDCEPAARAIIETAHRLSQRCHAREVSHLTLFAGIIHEEDGFAARVCRRGGADPRQLWSLMFANADQSKKKGSTGASCGLNEAACSRIVLPVLNAARQRAQNPHALTERDLFHAFCDIASPKFNDFLKAEVKDENFQTMETDLKVLRIIDPELGNPLDFLTQRSRRVMAAVLDLACQRRCSPIRNRLVLAGFLAVRRGLLVRRCQARGIPVRKVVSMLVESTNGNASLPITLTPEACARVITPMIDRARELAGATSFVTEGLLLQAFAEVTEPAFKDYLKAIGFDLDALAADAPVSSAKPHGSNGDRHEESSAS